MAAIWRRSRARAEQLAAVTLLDTADVLVSTTACLYQRGLANRRQARSLLKVASRLRRAGMTIIRAGLRRRWAGEKREH